MVHPALEFPLQKLPADTIALREEIRRFLAEEFASGAIPAGRGVFFQVNPAFSRKIGERGWIGMTWPKQYGGHERTMLERYVLAEELLAAGAPVWAHWMADRQIGPSLLRFGTEEQKRSLLPRIAEGSLYFCIGLSEPDSGSDLASVRTRGVRVAGGWVVNGTKIWTTAADTCHMMSLFARTASPAEDRYAGFSQFLVDMSLPGIAVRPIRTLSGEAELNEVVFQDVFLADDTVLGTVGDGWRQLTADLANERSGPERWLSTFDMLDRLALRARSFPNPHITREIGRLTAHLWTLRQMSLSVAGMLAAGKLPEIEAALVKDLGTEFERRVAEAARELVGEEERAALPPGDDFDEVLRVSVLQSPAFTLRGGAREILRGIIARGLGIR